MRYIVNQDSEQVAVVKEGLKRKNGYCPCMLEKNEDTKCPCKEMREQHNCCCGLYVGFSENKEQ